MIIGTSKKELDSLKRNLKTSFKKIKEEMDEHLESINASTNEIQTNYEYLCALDLKITKLNEKIDDIMMQLGMKKDFHIKHKIKLSIREQEVFLCLYTNDNLTFHDISQRTGLPEDLAKTLIKNMISRGVAVVKREAKNTVHLSLDRDFKDLQTRENIVDIQDAVSRQLR